jgi:hypothetical protein
MAGADAIAGAAPATASNAGRLPRNCGHARSAGRAADRTSRAARSAARSASSSNVGRRDAAAYQKREVVKVIVVRAHGLRLHDRIARSILHPAGDGAVRVRPLHDLQVVRLQISGQRLRVKARLAVPCGGLPIEGIRSGQRLQARQETSARAAAERDRTAALVLRSEIRAVHRAHDLRAGGVFVAPRLHGAAHGAAEQLSQTVRSGGQSKSPGTDRPHGMSACYFVAK